MYFELQPVLSYNALLNFIVAERGVGKTFSTKKFCINDFLKNSNQFVYIRRYKSELENAMEGFFSQLQDAGIFKDLNFEIKTSKKSITKFLCNGQIIGYAIPLSKISCSMSS